MNQFSVLVMALLSLTSAKSFADRMDDRIDLSTRKLSDLVNARAHTTLQPAMKASVLASINAAITGITGVIPVPIPVPQPQPQPQPYPQPVPQQVVTLTIEGKGTTIYAAGEYDFYNQCKQAYASLGYKGTNVDEVTVQVDFGQSVKKSTGGWWQSANRVCVNATIAATQAGLRSAVPGYPAYTYVIAGTVETSQDFLLTGFDTVSLSQSCNAEIARAVPEGQNTDEIYLAVNFNGAGEKKLSTGGWWHSTAEICGVILQEALKHAPYQAPVYGPYPSQR